MAYVVHSVCLNVPVWVPWRDRPLTADVRTEDRTEAIDLVDWDADGFPEPFPAFRIRSVSSEIEVYPFGRSVEEVFAVGERLMSGSKNLFVVVAGDVVTYLPSLARGTEVRRYSEESFRYTLKVRSVGPVVSVSSAGWALADNPFDRQTLACMLDDALDRGWNEAPYRQILTLLEKYPARPLECS